MKLAHLALIFTLFTVTTVPAATRYDRLGYPAACSIYDVCENDLCLRPNVPLNAFLLIDQDGVLFMTNDFDKPKVKLGFFESIDQARSFVTRAIDRDFGTVIVPRNDVSDGFALSVYSVQTTAGKTGISKRFTNILCNKIEKEPN